MAPVVLGNLPNLTSPSGIAIIVVVIILILYLIESYVLSVPLPHGIALVREPPGARRFSWRTRLAYYTNSPALFKEAYENHLKKGEPVVIPTLGLRSDLLMPPNSIKWVLSHPDEVLAMNDALVELDQVKWSLGHTKYVGDAWQGNLIKTDMNRVLESICATLNDELRLAFEENFGTDTESWKEIQLDEAYKIIIAQAAGRFTVGLPLCRNKDYILTSAKINQCLMMNAGFLGVLPQVLRPIVGPLFNIRTRRYVKHIAGYFLPLWKERQRIHEADPTYQHHDEPQDHVQMMLRHYYREGLASTESDMDMTCRLVSSNFGSMHNTTMQAINLTMNVLASDAEFNTIAALREEFDRVLGPDPDQVVWTKSLVSQLVRADSVSRETLRLNSFGGRAIFRQVMTSDFKLQDGCHIPKGTMISFLGQAIQHDEEVYEDAAKYDPFRFSRMRELAASRDEKPPAVGLVSTSVEFLPWGHGKHACPGRFLIDFELKMFLAYMLRNYDISFPESYQGKRPPNVWGAEALFPPGGTKILVKRRSNK